MTPATLLRRAIAAAALMAAVSAASAADAPRATLERDTSFTAHSAYRKIKKRHPEASIASDQHPAGVRVDRDVVYATRGEGRELHADVFAPDSTRSGRQAVVMVHGGGWSSGDKSLQHYMAARLARKGIVAVAVEYRLHPEAIYPAGLHDVKDAVAWLRRNAGRYGVDPARIAVWGCSAGGQIATLAGVTNGSEAHSGASGAESSRVNGIVCMDGVATFVSESNIDEARRRLAERGEQAVCSRWLGGSYDEAPQAWRSASAVLHVTGQSAPICFINSLLPRYSDGRDELMALYDKAGIHNERHTIDADIHPFWLFHPWVDTAVDTAAEFLNALPRLSF